MHLRDPRAPAGRIDATPPVRRAARLAGFVLAATLLACAKREPTRDELDVTMRVSPDPPVVGTATLDFDVRHSGHPMNGARVSVEGTMTHPGMTPSFAEAREIAPGVHRASLDLTMAGDWVILVDVRPGGAGKPVRRELPLRGVRAR